MALVKFQNHSAIKNAQNNPRVIATRTTVNGDCLKVVDNHVSGGITIKEAGVPFATVAEAKAENVWMAMNIVDKPEILNYADFKIEQGEYLRLFNLTKLAGEIIEVSSDICTTAFASVPVGAILIPCDATSDVANPTKLKVADEEDTGYKTTFKVIAKTTFGAFTIDGAGNGGYELKIVVA